MINPTCSFQIFFFSRRKRTVWPSASQLNIYRLKEAANSYELRCSHLLIDLLSYPLNQLFIGSISRGNLHAYQFSLREMANNNADNNAGKS